MFASGCSFLFERKCAHENIKYLSEDLQGLVRGNLRVEVIRVGAVLVVWFPLKCRASDRVRVRIRVRVRVRVGVRAIGLAPYIHSGSA